MRIRDDIVGRTYVPPSPWFIWYPSVARRSLATIGREYTRFPHGFYTQQPVYVAPLRGENILVDPPAMAFEANLRCSPLRHLRDRRSDSATHNRLARSTKLALPGVLFLATMTLLRQLASLPSHDALGPHHHHLLCLRIENNVVIVDRCGALTFVDHVGSLEAMLSMRQMPKTFRGCMLSI